MQGTKMAQNDKLGQSLLGGIHVLPLVVAHKVKY
jgi:hypothetical protein